MEDKLLQRFDKYINLLESRTVDMADMRSCTASFLLAFVAINSLSKLTCNNHDYEKFKQGEEGFINNNRIKGFLECYMEDPKYKEFCDRICIFYEDLFSFGFAVKVTMYRNPSFESIDKTFHLVVDESGRFHINSSWFVYDLREAIDAIKDNIRSDGDLYRNLNRLAWSRVKWNPV